MFISRRSRTNNHLAWRVRLFSGAALLTLVGLFTDQRLPIWGAIGLLLVAFLLRFAGGVASEADDRDGNNAENPTPPETPER